jgi:hypothetical protein
VCPPNGWRLSCGDFPVWTLSNFLSNEGPASCMRLLGNTLLNSQLGNPYHCKAESDRVDVTFVCRDFDSLVPGALHKDVVAARTFVGGA